MSALIEIPLIMVVFQTFLPYIMWWIPHSLAYLSDFLITFVTFDDLLFQAFGGRPFPSALMKPIGTFSLLP